MNRTAADLAVKQWVVVTGAALSAAPFVGFDVPNWGYLFFALVAWGHLLSGIWFGLRKEIRRGQ